MGLPGLPGAHLLTVAAEQALRPGAQAGEGCSWSRVTGTSSLVSVTLAQCASGVGAGRGKTTFGVCSEGLGLLSTE